MESSVPTAGTYFRTDQLRSDLRGRTLRGGVVTILGQGSKFALNLVSLAVLTRLLLPKDFGLLAMVAAVTGFVNLFKDLGLSAATMQKDEITHEQVSSLFWLNVLLGMGAMLASIALSPAIAWFFAEPRLMGIACALSVAFPFGGLTVQHQALLSRQMRFGVLASIELTSMAAGIMAAIVAAKAGWGYWSLVCMQVTMAIATCILVWARCSWRPLGPRRGADVKSMIAFGGHLTGFNLVNFLVRNVDNLLVGKFVGPLGLGLYSKAYQLLLLPIQLINGPISRVAVPTLSRLQSDPERYRAYYRKANLLIGMLSMPVVVFIFAAADPAIYLLMGPQWVEVVTLFRWLAPAAFVGTFHVATGWVYVSLGQTDRQFKMGLVVSPLTLLAFAIGIHWGAVGVAAAYSISVCALRYPTLVYCFKTTPLRVRDVSSVLWRPTVISLAAGPAVLAVEQYWPWHGHAALSLAVDFLVYAACYAAGWMIVPDGRRQLREVRQLLKEIGRRPRKRADAAGMEVA